MEAVGAAVWKLVGRLGLPGWSTATPWRLREGAANQIPAAARAVDLWQEDTSFPDQAEDIAVEVRLALALTHEIKEPPNRS